MYLSVKHDWIISSRTFDARLAHVSDYVRTPLRKLATNRSSIKSLSVARAFHQRNVNALTHSPRVSSGRLWPQRGARDRDHSAFAAMCFITVWLGAAAATSKVCIMYDKADRGGRDSRPVVFIQRRVIGASSLSTNRPLSIDAKFRPLSLLRHSRPLSRFVISTIGNFAQSARRNFARAEIRELLKKRERKRHWQKYNLFADIEINMKSLQKFDDCWLGRSIFIAVF